MASHSSFASATHAEQHERSFVLQLSRKDVCQRAACSRGAWASVVSWYVADWSEFAGRMYAHLPSSRSLGSVERAFFRRHLRGHSEGLLLRSC